MDQKKENEQKSPFSELEEDVLDFWKKNKIFEKSVERPASQGNYVFYDGPPFITGLPHYATLLPSIVKDVIPRYFTMKGYRVDRVWGWDCHGLPAENKVEKNLGLRNKKDIEDLGVGKFVGACRDYVSTSSAQWEWYIDRIGRWVDMKNAYKTMDIEFMESVIWAFKELYNKGLIYEGYRTSLHCPRCATPLSKFEITMDAGSYKDVEDDSVVVEFETNEDFFILAWTTTPWTLPGNLALAVGENLDYVVVKSGGKKYVVAKEKLEEIFKNKEKEVIKEIKGSDLVGLSYKSVFDLKNKEIAENNNVFKVYAADFVNTEEGTGIVHVAPNFGEDDFELGKKHNLPIIELMDESGIYLDSAGEWSGQYFKKANKKAIVDLGDKLFLQSKSTHSYPFCYRCNTSLIHKTQKAWYLNIESIRKKMVKTNNDINWVPEHFKDGRFKYNLEHAPDWCLSRSRYWGSPVPVWRCSDCDNIKVLGSLDEIESLGGKKIKDLHRPEIDKVTFKCDSCTDGKMKRVEEVLDCWFESGSMPFAQFHYPFEKEKDWNNLFPSDFIIEYTGQLRGWFYYLHVLSNALFDSLAFRNVIVTGVLAGDDGRKMSKSLGNYPDPRIVLNKYGSDALRIYFMSNPIMVGGDTNLSEIDIQDALRKNVILLTNVLKFYESFAKERKYYLNEETLECPKAKNILDQWILGRLSETIKIISENLEDYNLPPASIAITRFIDDMSTWYVRRSRNRFKGEDEVDAQDAVRTTGYVLSQLSKAIAPVMPFIAERVWQKVSGNNFKDKEKSVHLLSYPNYNGTLIDEKIFKEMDKVREFVSLALKERADAGIKVRQPLSVLEISAEGLFLEKREDLLELIKDEVNVKEIIFEEKLEGGVLLKKEITPELKEEGDVRDILRTIQSMRKEADLVPSDRINLFYSDSKLEELFSKWRETFNRDAGVEEFTQKSPKKHLAKKNFGEEDHYIAIFKK